MNLVFFDSDAWFISSIYFFGYILKSSVQVSNTLLIIFFFAFYFIFEFAVSPKPEVYGLTMRAHTSGNDLLRFSGARNRLDNGILFFIATDALLVAIIIVFLYSTFYKSFKSFITLMIFPLIFVIESKIAFLFYHNWRTFKSYDNNCVFILHDL